MERVERIEYQGQSFSVRVDSQRFYDAIVIVEALDRPGYIRKQHYSPMVPREFDRQLSDVAWAMVVELSEEMQRNNTYLGV